MVHSLYIRMVKSNSWRIRKNGQPFQISYLHSAMWPLLLGSYLWTRNCAGLLIVAKQSSRPNHMATM